ncbi:MAG: LysM peptidoglycan-binding domain-containing protein [Opitutales bacterium]
MKSSVDGAARTQGELIPATVVNGGGLDSAFNAGLDNDPISFQPTDLIAPIDPLEPMGNVQTVDIAGSGTQTYTIKKGDNLWSISKRFNVSLTELYALNGLNKNSVLRIGQQIQIPGDGSSAAITTVSPEVYQPSGFSQATATYTVQRGDTLSKIANQYDTSVAAIKAANGKTSDIIRVGESLTIPVGANATPDTPAPSASAPTAGTATASIGATQTHTVRSGEYPAQIAKQYGMTTAELLSINSISDPRKLRVGQQLIVSGTGSSQNVDSRIETVASPATGPVTVAPSTPRQVAPRTEPVEIRVIEADPLVEGEFPAAESDDVFENAVQIPVIRLEE